MVKDARNYYTVPGGCSLLGGCHSQGAFDHKKNFHYISLKHSPIKKIFKKKCILRVTFPFFCD